MKTKSDSKIKMWNERLHLAALTKDELIRVALLAVIIGLIFCMYHFLGNTTNIKLYGRSSFSWMLGRWANMGGDFSHAWLIPIVSIVIIWYKRKDFVAAPKQVCNIGLSVIIMALLLHYLSAKAQQTRASIFALIMLSWSIPFYLYGWEVAKLLIFPCSYLMFCIPMNFLDQITFPLRMIMTVMSTHLLNGLGIAVERTGSAIYSLSGGFNFDVASPCSGLRSLLALTALTAVYANFTQKTILKKWILFLSSIPLAIIGNTARITSIGLVAEAFGEEFASKLYHDYSGYVVFGVAISLMIAVGNMLNADYSQVWKQWKQTFINPISSSSPS